MSLQPHILSVLLYYDIWEYPLTAREIFTFLPVNSITFNDFEIALRNSLSNGVVGEENGYYYVQTRTSAVVAKRLAMMDHARGMWTRARLSMHIIRRFPFVRGIMVSGDLSKNATTKESDVDFFIITEPRRLWIARSLLILFKKVFLLNSKKYFCLNSFTTSDNLLLDEQSVFHATEVATLKPLYNSALFRRYVETNTWINGFFPNYRLPETFIPPVQEKRSVVQRMLELAFTLLPCDALDTLLMKKMRSIWAKRYPQYDSATREALFRSTRQESRAYAGNFQGKILQLYRERLEQFGIQGESSRLQHCSRPVTQCDNAITPINSVFRAT